MSDALNRVADHLEILDELTAEAPLTVAEVALLLRVDERTVRGYIASGKLAGCFQVGNAWRIPRRSVSDLIKQRPNGDHR